MVTEAAAMAQESGNANEIIHYFGQEWAPGVFIHMQTMYMTWITMAIVFLLFFVASRNPKLVPSGLQNVMEWFIEFLTGLMEGTLGMKGSKYMAPFMITLFMFIFVGNEIGMLPQVGVHWTSPTNDINTTFALSLTVALGVYVVGVCQHGMGHFRHFISPSPAFLPLHLLEEITKPLTMALRLFGNILAGEILLIVLYQLSPWIIPEFWVMFSLFIGFLQAFIFTMLALTSYAIVFAHH
ncbi:F0F1 ATP synthase subunit A [Phascolarctobacterium sp.]|uniref:F0F1 ATP synthase subunit A n=1 Tax=Phascolarctobacterium sp. TaxID=2049039 RepID=UPI0015AFEDF9|nr:F0F1 ATP synthase subunit A [uncultured Phascolarctobacterium sp.]